MALALHKSAGNGCGHDREYCRYYVRSKKKEKAPWIITTTKERVADYYYHPSKLLKKLHWMGKPKRRSERREAITTVAQVLVDYMDLDTLYVGTYHKACYGLNNLRTSFIARQAKFTIKRVQRALKDLELAGYIIIERRALEYEYGYYQSNTIQLTRHFFTDLKIDNAILERSRDIKRKSNARKLRKGLGKGSPWGQVTGRKLPHQRRQAQRVYTADAPKTMDKEIPVSTPRATEKSKGSQGYKYCMEVLKKCTGNTS